MQTSERLSLEQIQAFLENSDEVEFKGQNREEVYGWVNQTLRQQRYEGLLRSQRGLVRRYVEKMTGLSRAQTTRLITVYLRGKEVKLQPYQRRRFAQRYTREDIALLAGVDEAHETLSGPATKKLLQRACYNFHETRYQSLARISVAQLYRLRGSRAYRERRIKYQATRPTQVSIGERRKPEPRAGSAPSGRALRRRRARASAERWRVPLRRSAVRRPSRTGTSASTRRRLRGAGA